MISTLIFIFINLNSKDDRYYNSENVIEFNKKNIDLEENESYIWQIEIPSIDMMANIAEGTSKEILEEYVGHFEETNVKYGNVGLAAHNRGYLVNYFSNIKNLKIGDSIIYRYNNYMVNYEVISNKIILDSDWSCLENTDNNMITLITCVEDEPTYRRCIQAVEKIE